MANAPVALHAQLSEMFVAALPVRMDPQTGQPERRFVESLMARLRELALTRAMTNARSELRRLDSDPDADPARQRQIAQALAALERERAAIRDVGA